MSDPFDAFEAFDPFEAVPLDVGEPDGPDEEAAAPSPPAESTDKAADTPADDAADRARVTTRRWAATRRSLGLTERPATKPIASAETPPAAEARARPVEPIASSPQVAPALAPDRGLGSIRAIALPELRAAVTRLRAHGHDAEVINQLDVESEPCLAMQFRPDAGPLGFAVAAPTSHARFELRLAGPVDADPFDGIQLFAGFVPAGAETRFILLGRTSVHALPPDWVTQRIVDFVARTLER